MGIFKKNREVVKNGEAPINKTDTIESRLQDQEVKLDIPDDEIWTYRVEGLAAPHINKPYKYYTLKKIIFTVTIIIAVSLSCYFSVRTVQSDVLEFTPVSDGTYEFTKFGNTGFITEVDIDYVSELVYDTENPDVNTNFTFKKDESKVISTVREYAFNGDEKVKVINISENVTEIDGKSFYSCWALQRIEVDENNPNYCDVDGVLYNKDKTELICYPCDHDTYLVEKYGYSDSKDENGNWVEPTGEEFEQYKKDVMTYVVPSTVTTIGELAFNYAHMAVVYVPEGLKTIETLGFYEIPRMEHIYSYKTGNIVEDTHFTAEEALGEVYLSLPEGLEYIGSDAFSYNQSMTYMYIPESVTYIGHHAFWDTVYKEDGELRGISVVNVAVSEDEFKKNVDDGDQWRPQYDFLLFKKSIDINYSAERAEK